MNPRVVTLFEASGSAAACFSIRVTSKRIIKDRFECESYLAHPPDIIQVNLKFDVAPEYGSGGAAALKRVLVAGTRSQSLFYLGLWKRAWMLERFGLSCTVLQQTVSFVSHRIRRARHLEGETTDAGEGVGSRQTRSRNTNEGFLIKYTSYIKYEFNIEKLCYWETMDMRAEIIIISHSHLEIYPYDFYTFEGTYMRTIY